MIAPVNQFAAELHYATEDYRALVYVYAPHQRAALSQLRIELAFEARDIASFRWVSGNRLAAVVTPPQL